MKIVFGFLVGIGLVYAFYSGAVAGYSYFQVRGIVEDTVGERARTDRSERASRIEQDILRKASENGLTLNLRELSVTEDDRTLRVLIRWSYPVFIYKGEALLSMPLSFDKSFEMLAARYQ